MLRQERTKSAYFVMSAIGISFLLSLALLQMFFALLILLWLFEPLNRKNFKLEKIEYYFLFFLGVRLASIFFSEYFELSKHAFYKDALFYTGLFPLVYYVKQFSSEQKKNILLIFLSASVLVSLIGIGKFALGIKPRAESIVSGYATFSTFLLPGLALYFSFFSELKKRTNAWWITLGGMTLFLAIILALGRADLAIAVLLLLFGMLLKKMEWKYFLPMVLLAITLSYVAFQINTSEIQVRVQQPTTMSDRDILWGTAFDLAGKHPLLGFGPRTFDKVFSKRNLLSDKDVGSWHNDYITIYLESGIVGFLSLLLLLVEIVRTGFKKFYRSNDWRWGVFFSLVALILSAGLSGFLNNPILSLLFVFLLSFFVVEQATV